MYEQAERSQRELSVAKAERSQNIDRLGNRASRPIQKFLTINHAGVYPSDSIRKIFNKAMKSSTVALSIGLFSSAATAMGVSGYLAWNSLAGTELRTQPLTAQTIAPPAALARVSAPVSPAALQPTQAIPASTSSLQTTQSTVPRVANSQVTQSNLQLFLSQAENDVLFDLAQVLQPSEYDRLSQTERLAIVRQVHNWLQSGADYWSLRSEFDAIYQTQIAGDYAFNRETYIKFTVERFAPDTWAVLLPPSLGEMQGEMGMPDYGMPDYGIPDYGMPDYGMPNQWLGEIPHQEPMLPPDMPPDFYPQPYAQPYPQPGWNFEPPVDPQQPEPDYRQQPQPNPVPTPDSQNPNVREISIQDRSNQPLY